MSNAGGDQTISLRARQAFCDRFQLVNINEASDARADVTTLEQGRAFGKSIVRSLEINRQNTDAGSQREIADHRLEVGHLSTH